MKDCSKIKILIFAVIFIASCKPDSLPNNLVFDSAQWKSGDVRTRGRMANDLQRGNILTKKTKAEVAELLGKPDNVYNPGRWSYEVNLGGTGNAVTSKVYFNVSFDEKTEKVTGSIFTGGQILGFF